MRLVRQYLVYLLLRTVLCLIQAVRIETCHTGCRLLASLFCRLPVRRGVTDDNLRHAFPQLTAAERKELARQMWEHLFLFVCELAHLPRKVHETNWRDYVRLGNADVLVRALLDERPVVIVSAHYGNFEMGGYVLGILGFPTHTVARTLDNPFVDRFLNWFRGRTGQHIIPKVGGYDQIERVLHNNGTMLLLGDQYAGNKGLWVDFFGRPASTHKAIALFALQHDAPLAVGYTRRLDRPLRSELNLIGAADPRSDAPQVRGARELTAWYTKLIEGFIREAPGQYWWVHRRWKEKRGRPGRRRNAA